MPGIAKYMNANLWKGREIPFLHVAFSILNSYLSNTTVNMRMIRQYDRNIREYVLPYTSITYYSLPLHSLICYIFCIIMKGEEGSDRK